jgi:P-loop containing dynein motor region
MAALPPQADTTTNSKSFSIGQSDVVTTSISVSASTVCTANDMRRCISDGLILKGRTVLGTLLDQSTIIAIDDINVPLAHSQHNAGATTSPYEAVRQVCNALLHSDRYNFNASELGVQAYIHSAIA